MDEFFEDHPNWGKVIISFIAVLLTLAVALPVTFNQINDLKDEAAAEHEQRVKDEGVLCDAIEVLEDWQLEFYGEGGEWQTFLVALDAYIDATDDAIAANATAIVTLNEWYDDFYGEDGEWSTFLTAWADFQAQYIKDKATYYSALANWSTYFSTKCCGELGE